MRGKRPSPPSSLSRAASLQIRELPLREFGAQKRFTRYVYMHIRNTYTLEATRRSTRANLSRRDARLLRTFRVREKRDETRFAAAQHGARRANDDETAATRRDVTYAGAGRRRRTTRALGGRGANDDGRSRQWPTISTTSAGKEDICACSRTYRPIAPRAVGNCVSDIIKNKEQIYVHKYKIT